MEFYVTRSKDFLSHKEDDELQHYGILGMKWGVRRYQNPDGSLTPAGRKRYWTGAGLEDKGGESTGSSSTQNKRTQKENLKNYNKYNRDNKIDPKLCEEFSESNKKLIDEYISAETERQKLLCEMGPEAIAKKASELYEEERRKPSDPFEDVDRIGEDIFSHDQWDIENAEDLLAVSSKEYASADSRRIEKGIELQDAWHNTVKNYAGDEAKNSYSMFWNTRNKVFQDATGKDQLAYLDEFYAAMNKALDEERSKIKHSDILAHYGILGMKWGVRRYQDKKRPVSTD